MWCSPPSLRSRTFLDFIRAYNFPDDYNAVDSLAERLLTTENGLLTYKDSRGVDCYFYYFSFGEGSNIDILGYIPASQIQPEVVEWSIVLLVCGTLFLLFLIDGAYILSINQNLRRAVDMAEHANQAKTQFLSTISHDIRTPMNAVIGMTEIAKLHLDDAGYVRDCLDKVSASSSHLLTLVNDILDISKVESGRMTLDPCAVSLSEEVEKLSGMVRPSAAVRGVAFTLRMQDITQDIVVTDPLRLRQVLINLLTNAVKYDGSIMAFFEGDVPFYVCNAECVSGMKKRESKSETFHAAPFEYEFLYALLGDSGAYVYLESWTASRSARTATRPSWPSSSCALCPQGSTRWRASRGFPPSRRTAPTSATPVSGIPMPPSSPSPTTAASPRPCATPSSRSAATSARASTRLPARRPAPSCSSAPAELPFPHIAAGAVPKGPRLLFA